LQVYLLVQAVTVPANILAMRLVVIHSKLRFMKISLPTSLDEKSHFAIHTLDAMGNLLSLVLFSNFPITSLNTEATFQLELLLDKKNIRGSVYQNDYHNRKLSCKYLIIF